MGVTITTRVSDEVARDVDEIAEAELLDRSAVIRRLLVEAIREWKVKRALRSYREGKITLWRAARECNATLREMMRMAAERGIPYQYSIEDLQRDFKCVLEEREG